MGIYAILIPALFSLSLFFNTGKILKSIIITLDIVILLFMLGFLPRVFIVVLLIGIALINYKIVLKTIKYYLIAYITIFAGAFYMYLIVLHYLPELKLKSFLNDNVFIFLYLLILYPVGIILNEKIFNKTKHQ